MTILQQPQEMQQQAQFYCVADGEGVWPSRFVECPKVGDMVKSLNNDRTLTVIGITHLISKAPPFSPMIEIQLGTENESEPID